MSSKPKLKPLVPKPKAADTGSLGEEVVSQWLRSQGWLILQQRWHCRWGELDLVIGQPDLKCPQNPISLAFVEVKTRSSGNWDEDGALAITPQKQAKLWKAAQLFLSAHPILAELPCRFDVALVQCQRARSATVQANPLHAHTTLMKDGYQLTLLDYIQNAFTL